MAIEALKHSAEDLSTSKEAIYWTENSPNSKLNQIKWLLGKSDNPNIKNLMNFILNKNYVWFQKAIWYKGKLDGKLWATSLDNTTSYIDKEEQLDKIDVYTDAELNQISDSFKNNAENLVNWIKNITKKRWERWDASLKKYVKYEEDVGFILTWKNLELKHMYIMSENMNELDNNTLTGWIIYEEINDKINDLSIIFMWNNIVINNKYVLTPVGTMCEYKNIFNIVKWTNKEKNTAHHGLLTPLYDYLKQNRSIFEKQSDSILQVDISQQRQSNTDAPTKNNNRESRNNYNDEIPDGVMSNSIKNWEYTKPGIKSWNKTHSRRDGKDMYEYNIKWSDNNIEKIWAGFSTINNNHYEISKGFMMDLSQRKLYLKNMSMNEWKDDSNYVSWRNRVFDFSDISINNGVITLKWKDRNHTITVNWYTTQSRGYDHGYAWERARDQFYTIVMNNKEKFT